ncbi:MAG: 1-deoxy-D-xylulose-5-phosphate synthase [Phycisphaerae bacterium]
MNTLSKIQSPRDLADLSIGQLETLASEIRERIVSVVSQTGGHIASNLGIVELTIALHRVFDFADDRLLWDVGHQSYVHKLLTGRNERFETLRQAGGISGFPNTNESEYDLFNVGHAGTAIATAVGMARGDAAMGYSKRTVALVGDASIVNGVAFEGLNQAGLLRRQFMVILNDNSMGIAKTQGGLADYLARFRVSHLYEDVKKQVKALLPKVPVVGKTVFGALDHIKEGIKATMSPHQIFEQLGFVYVGPVDGHDVKHLIEILDLLKDVEHPVLLHVHTQKGRGAEWATTDPCAFHSPGKVVVEGGKAKVVKGATKSWTSAFADTFLTLAREDKHLVALTAAMPDGTGVNKVLQELPEQALDCGIAESCTVDIAAGMAKSGLRPIACIYSTFLQRAFDQIFQEVVLQGLPVGFCIDRAGLVGGDGAVHHGYLDIAYLRVFQNMILMAPADEPELLECLKLGRKLDQPFAIRYPRDAVPTPLAKEPHPFYIGKSKTVREGSDATILAYGTQVQHALEAARMLAEDGIETTVVNARFAKPIDEDMVMTAISKATPVVTVEDHSIAGGFGSAVLETANKLGLPTEAIVRLGLDENRFYAHGARGGQLADAGIDAVGIATRVGKLVRARRGELAETTKERRVS